jgi:hypothetical protein
VRVKTINGVVDIEKLRIDESSSLATNEIGLATFADRRTGSSSTTTASTGSPAASS